MNTKRLSLSPRFAPTENREKTYMDIIQTAKVCALGFEQGRKFSVVESPQQNISRILTKDLRKKT